MNSPILVEKEPIFVDVDGVLCNNTLGKYTKAEPIFENIAKINKLYDEGHIIIIWTARGGTTGINWFAVTLQQLKDWGVKYHELRMGKPPFARLIDDRAVHINDV